MRFWSLFLVMNACTNEPEDSGTPADTSVESDADSDADSDTDADSDSDSDSDTDPADATVAGDIEWYDGRVGAGVGVQFCRTVCYTADADGNGHFEFESLGAGTYRLDAIGPSVSDELGTVLYKVELAVSGAYVAPYTIVLPRVDGPGSMASGSHTFGAVTLTAPAGSIEVPVLHDDDQFWAGVIPGPLADYWGQPTTAFGVTFEPLLSTVSAPIDVRVVDVVAQDGSYDVYSVLEAGDLEGPVGTAAVAAGVATATGLTPTLLTSLLFVPQ